MTWHGQTRGGWLRRQATLPVQAFTPQPRGAVAMDTGTGARTNDYSPRGTDRVRPASARRRARPAIRSWRSVLVVLAIALAVLVVMATRARARSGPPATAGPVRVSIDGDNGPGLAPFPRSAT
jgi:hypothetical protein